MKLCSQYQTLNLKLKTLFLVNSVYTNNVLNDRVHV